MRIEVSGFCEGFEVKVMRPGDPGFDEAAASCSPPTFKTEKPPRPDFVEYRKGRAI